MAITITQAEAAVAIRIATDQESIPPSITATLDFLFPATQEMILTYAPDAPDVIHNAATIRLLGWLYDTDSSDPRNGRPLLSSGASALLSQWRDHRAGAIDAAVVQATSTTPPPPTLPTIPNVGTFLLFSDEGKLTWLSFPKPGPATGEGSRTIPPLPPEGNFVLCARNGRLEWVKFPKPLLETIYEFMTEEKQE